MALFHVCYSSFSRLPSPKGAILSVGSRQKDRRGSRPIAPLGPEFVIFGFSSNVFYNRIRETKSNCKTFFMKFQKKVNRPGTADGFGRITGQAGAAKRKCLLLVQFFYNAINDIISCAFHPGFNFFLGAAKFNIFDKNPGAV